MRTTTRKRFGAVAVALALAGAGLLATAGGASAQTPVGTTAITTVFDLNGTYSDGGRARPVISRSGDTLKVDMSSLRRRDGSGAVLSPTSIVVNFPDDATYFATLEAPGTIRWTNSSTWQKVKHVPDVLGRDLGRATAILDDAGFVLGTVTTYVDRSCRYIDMVGRQNPGAGSSAAPGSAVNVSIGMRPPTDCP